jgi:hypothetical protein
MSPHDKFHIKPKLYITLFEAQLVRSYLMAYKSSFLIDLNEEFRIVIITSPELDSVVKEGINNAGLYGLVSVINFNSYRGSFFTNLMSFFLYWSNKSPAIKLRIHRLWYQDKIFLKTLARILVNRIPTRNKIVIKLFRFLHYKSFQYELLRNNFNSSFFIESTDLLFATSSTNNWEDIPVAIYFKMHEARIVGTVRSWDNLTNHGYLKLIPNVFLAHSEIMLGYSREFQNIASANIDLAVTPVYQELFRLPKSSSHLEIVKIAYMCMGKSTNPDDENLVRWLVSEWKSLPNRFHLTILQHPRFMLNLDSIIPDENISVNVFRYENSNLTDYYEFISQQNLVLCGGTTAALDAAFIGIPVAAIGFEIIKQSYSTSALRYFDTKPHTKDFFETCNVLIISNKDDLMKILVQNREISSMNEDLVSKFTGKSDVNFNSVLINALKDN